MKGPTPEELAESERAAAATTPQTEGGRQALVTTLLLLAGIVLLAFLRPRVAGTVGIFAAIIVMIMLHELGHFVMAKRAGMKVTEFFLGFGPRLWSIRRGETEYGVKAIPAGGYVRIIGMSNLDEVDPGRRGPYLPREALPPPPGRGHGRLHDALHHRRLPPFPALAGRRASLRRGRSSPRSCPIPPPSRAISGSGDRIVAVNGVAVDEWEDVPSYIQAHGESELVFTVVREGWQNRSTSRCGPGRR